MFTPLHFVWLALCVILIAVVCLWLQQHKPDLRKVLTAACVISVISELIKVFSCIKLVPAADGAMMTPYLEMQHLPLHLCSMQIILIFYARFAKDSPRRDTLLAFMYPTCIAGAFLALLMPSIFSNSIESSQAFSHPLAYQYFLYHCILIILGVYIVTSRQVRIQPKHALSTLVILAVMAFLSLYINSMFAAPVYVNGELVSVEYTPNMLFTYETPIGIAFTELWHWYLYLGILVVIAVLLIAVFYLPFLLKARKEHPHAKH